MSFWRRALAVGICGFACATNPFGFATGEARAASTNAQTLTPSLTDDAIRLAPKQQPGCDSAGSGKWECVAKGGLHDTTGGKAPCAEVGTYFYGPPARGSSQAEACQAAKHGLNATVPQGCYPKHVDCKCKKN